MAEPSYDLKHTALISNLASEQNSKHGLKSIEALIHPIGLRHYRMETLDGLDDVIQECTQQQINLLIINAGDGTVSRILEAIRQTSPYQQEPTLALLHGGTTNMIHNDVGFPGNPANGLNKLLQNLNKYHYTITERYPLLVKRQNTERILHGFFLGTHAVLKGILRTRERFHQRNSKGTVSELISVITMLWRLMGHRVKHDPILSPISVQISYDEKNWQRISHILLMAVSLRKMILGIKPLRRGQHAGLAVLNAPDYRLGSLARKFLRGNADTLESIYLQGDFGWILDGEIHQHQTTDGVLSITTGKPVRFLVPVS